MTRNILILGEENASDSIAKLVREKNFGRISGFVMTGDDGDGEQMERTKKSGAPAVPTLSLQEILSGNGFLSTISDVVITTDGMDRSGIQAFLVRCYEAGIKVHEMPELYVKLAKRIPVRHVHHEWIVPHLTAPPHNLYTVFHDVSNFCLGILGLLLIAPLFPIIGAMIKLDSRGPVFYSQKRMGKNGRAFTLIKFRTMVADADKRGGAWTKKDDDRITRFGRLLRKYRLDELPQFINILKGDMALIGPRPDAYNLIEQFRKEIPFYDYRHLVRPGITGWAQVNHGNTCTIEGSLEKLQYDLYWIKNRSFWLDLKIIFKSIKVMLTGYGAV